MDGLRGIIEAVEAGRPIYVWVAHESRWVRIDPPPAPDGES